MHTSLGLNSGVGSHLARWVLFHGCSLPFLADWHLWIRLVVRASVGQGEEGWEYMLKETEKPLNTLHLDPSTHFWNPLGQIGWEETWIYCSADFYLCFQSTWPWADCNCKWMKTQEKKHSEGEKEDASMLPDSTAAFVVSDGQRVTVLRHQTLQKPQHCCTVVLDFCILQLFYMWAWIAKDGGRSLLCPAEFIVLETNTHGILPKCMCHSK